MTDFRMFDPAVARLWQIDPIDKEDRSPYSWVLNNPILYNDILGLDTVRYDDLDDTPIDVDEDVVILDEVTVEAERPDASDEDTHLVPGFGLVKRGEKILPHQDGVPGFEDLFGKRKVGAGRLTFTVDVEGRLEGLAPMELTAPDIGARNPVRVYSSVKKVKSLLNLARKLGKNRAWRKEANKLITELSRGNFGAGKGSKQVVGNIHEMRGQAGARVYYRHTKDGTEIVGYSDKATQSKAIKEIIQVYGN